MYAKGERIWRATHPEEAAALDGQQRQQQAQHDEQQRQQQEGKEVRHACDAMLTDPTRSFVGSQIYFIYEQNKIPAVL